MNTYRISLWDHEAGPGGDFVLHLGGLALWRLRDAIREVRGMGYVSVSFRVERE